MFAMRARLLIATLWVGSMWTIGYLVAPTLFATLADSALAGSIAGRLFRYQAWVAVASGVALLVLLKFGSAADDGKRQRQLMLIVLAMLLCSLLGYFALNPFMAQLRETAAAAGGVWEAGARARFGMLHGVSSVFYLIQSVLGVALILRLR